MHDDTHRHLDDRGRVDARGRRPCVFMRETEAFLPSEIVAARRDDESCSEMRCAPGPQVDESSWSQITGGLVSKGLDQHAGLRRSRMEQQGRARAKRPTRRSRVWSGPTPDALQLDAGPLWPRWTLEQTPGDTNLTDGAQQPAHVQLRGALRWGPAPARARPRRRDACETVSTRSPASTFLTLWSRKDVVRDGVGPLWTNAGACRWSARSTMAYAGRDHDGRRTMNGPRRTRCSALRAAPNPRRWTGTWL